MKRLANWVPLAVLVTIVAVTFIGVGIHKTATPARRNPTILPLGRAEKAIAVKAIESGHNREFTSVCSGALDAHGNCPAGSPVVEDGHYGVVGGNVVHFAGVTDNGQWFAAGRWCYVYLGNGTWGGCPASGPYLFSQHYTHGTFCTNSVIPGIPSGCLWENTITDQVVARWIFAHIHCDMAAAYGPTGAALNETAVIQATAVYQGLNNGWNCDFDSVGLLQWWSPGGILLQQNHFLTKLMPNADGGAMGLGKITA